MKSSRPEQPIIKNLRRKTLTLSQEALVKMGPLPSGTALPLVIRPAVDGVNLTTWATNNQELIVTHLLKHGGILFRDFDVRSAAEFEQFIRAISTELLEYTYGSTPRSHVSGNIYTSTEYPADQVIPLHNEMAYSRNWPMKIWFFCMTAAKKGGETPLADSRRVFERIDPKIRERFMQKKVMYVRTYRHNLDLPWQTVFQTTSKTAVETYCRYADISFEWQEGDRLVTRGVCQAVATHPGTGEMVWFNQAHLFHLSSLEAEVRQSLLSMYKQEELPRNAYYGDGSPIEASVLDEIREAYRQEAVSFPWQETDILMLDNMLVAHGRAPFVGQRKIVVGMAEEYNCQEI